MFYLHSIKKNLSRAASNPSLQLITSTDYKNQRFAKFKCNTKVLGYNKIVIRNEFKLLNNCHLNKLQKECFLSSIKVTPDSIPIPIQIIAQLCGSVGDLEFRLTENLAWDFYVKFRFDILLWGNQSVTKHKPDDLPEH